MIRTKYRKSISKEELNAFPVLALEKEIIIVDSPDAVPIAVNALQRCKVIGFDTETRPSFKKGVMYDVSLLQMASENIVYLFRLNRVGFHPALMDLLENPSIMKIGLSIKDDFHAINKCFEIAPASFVELQSYVKQFDIEDNSLQKIYAIVFGKKITKAQRLTNWEADELTDKQANYAALDAVACLELYLHLEKKRKQKEYYEKAKLKKSQQKPVINESTEQQDN
ncbi:MAG: 3'-5' exonuclease domain-containing protein 2 [Bacteroidales bacterium]|nr:3'-5' exonuclease domain-containing protein 2 [Bacteroidales bacterium]